MRSEMIRRNELRKPYTDIIFIHNDVVYRIELLNHVKKNVVTQIFRIHGIFLQVKKLQENIRCLMDDHITSEAVFNIEFYGKVCEMLKKRLVELNASPSVLQLLR